ncbi:hypothetical protein ASE16_14535 [Leifsonia sp. Root227]|uniref:acyltransferase family protein n=1 Tax=Leifsonia sp. Root227 TaxID=1736496 RepID=UPI0006FE463C|nr:acyltransferase [Leifsonia sp. Root227]KRC49889.1 hypothetical protein ASE16_14535 [Leifsonia sp. Root227]
MPSAQASSRSIAAGLRGHDNALGLIRLVLAFFVLVDHTFPLGGYGPDFGGQYTHEQANLGAIAVGGFFAISGYLIAKSGMSTDLLQFLWRRALRIFPGFLTVLLVAAFVVGPVIWVLNGHTLLSYFSFAPASPWHYLASNWTLAIGSYGIRDIFAATTPYGVQTGASVFNGSLWSLTYEWTCYLVIAVLLVTAVLRKARPVIAVIVAALFVAQIVQVLRPHALDAVLPLLTNELMLRLSYPFMVGALIAVYARSIPLDHRIGVASGVVAVATLFTGGYAVFGVPAGVYFVLWLGAVLPAPLRRVGRTNDYSYGVYIYGFLVQQTLAYFGLYKLGFFPFLLGATIVTAGCAWLSWHIVEKRAMMLKDWGPGRGIAHWWQWTTAAMRIRPRQLPPAPVDPNEAELPPVSPQPRTGAEEPASRPQ